MLSVNLPAPEFTARVRLRGRVKIRVRVDRFGLRLQLGSRLGIR